MIRLNQFKLWIQKQTPLNRIKRKNSNDYKDALKNNIKSNENKENSKFENSENIFKSFPIINNNQAYDFLHDNTKELNELSYEQALKIDNRTFFQYYVSLLQTKHILIFSFFYNKDFIQKL